MTRALVLVALAGCYSIPPFAGPFGNGDAGPIATDAPDGHMPSTHDEDGDGLFDDVDPCPHLPAPQIDSDHDGIGDDCDLEPGVPGETRLFYAFDTVPDLMRSGFGVGNVPDTFDLGANMFDAYLAPAQMFGSARIEIKVTVVGSADNVMSELGVSIGAADFRNDGYGCFISFNPANTANSQLVARDFSGTRDTRNTNQPLLGIEATISATRFAGGTFVCTLTPKTLPPQMVTFTPTANEHGFVNVKAAYVNLRLDYIHIVGRT